MTQTTISRVDSTSKEAQPDRHLLRQACAKAANDGGSFSIASSWDSPTGRWMTTYTINWPDPVTSGYGKKHATGGLF